MKKPFYRSRKGVIFGICRGIADHFDLNVVWIRLGLIVTFCLSGFFPIVLIYAILGLVFKLEPPIKPQNKSDEEFYQSFASSGSLGLSRMKSKFDALDKRIQRMESVVTDKAYDWERRLGAD